MLPGDMSAVDPIVRFQEWYAEAHAREAADPTAMSLATADATGCPASLACVVAGAALMKLKSPVA